LAFWSSRESPADVRHADVLEAAVVAIPDEKWGERPKGFVTLRPGASLSEAELIAFSGETLPGFKTPSEIDFCELPKTSTRKIKKFELRQRARRESQAPAPRPQVDEKRESRPALLARRPTSTIARATAPKAAYTASAAWEDQAMAIDALDVPYVPSRDVEADLTFYRDVLGARVAFAVEAMGTRVAEVAISPPSPRLVLADHLAGDAPVLLHRVSDLDDTLAHLSARGLRLERRVERRLARA
jgi:hypothetical protein